jgi:hypothetical protein
MTPLFVATEKFGPLDVQSWETYRAGAGIPGLVEVVSLDGSLCPRIINELQAEDWPHIVNEDFRVTYFYHLDYLLKRVVHVPRRNILGVYRNPDTHIETQPAPGDFVFLGYDLIEEQTQISALTNCGGFPDAFANAELNTFGLITGFERARGIQRRLAELHPQEPHAHCERYALWRLNEPVDAPPPLAPCP